MIENKTKNQNYVKPNISNFLQDDVKNIETTFDMIDKDVHSLNQNVTKLNKELSDSNEDGSLTKDSFEKQLEELEKKFNKKNKELLEKLTRLNETNYFLPNSYPFLYCRMTRAGKGYTTCNWTNDIHLNSLQAGEWLLKNFLGSNGGNFDTYTIEPSVQYINPENYWQKCDAWIENASTHEQYQYPSYDVVLMFIKNTTDQDITRNFNRLFSSSMGNLPEHGTTNSLAGYNGSCAYVGVPNNIETQSVSFIDWVIASDNGINTIGSVDSFNLTVPANKTIAFVFHSTACLKKISYGYFSFYSSIGIRDFNTFIGDGLEIDKEKTQKALQVKPKNILDLWN